MNRWPGQGYEYIENDLFEKGPFGGRRNRDSIPRPQTIEQKEISATVKQQAEAEAYLKKVVESGKKSLLKKARQSKTTSNFTAVARDRTADEINKRKA